ncbi:hypothetical protein BKN48_08850 [Bacillus subtilis]|nr:hypothetical protein BKN48_08850 [Bacillus subtilis]
MQIEEKTECKRTSSPHSLMLFLETDIWSMKIHKTKKLGFLYKLKISFRILKFSESNEEMDKLFPWRAVIGSMSYFNGAELIATREDTLFTKYKNYISLN